jgi:membrane associated rhomboid family serine protease
MIDVTCQCGASASEHESKTGQTIECGACRSRMTLLCGEALPDGAGTGDFDGKLTIRSGPARVGEQLFLGGVKDLEIGKLPEKHLPLPGKLLSRNHCKLQRVDFGPSRWKLIDTHSTNGVFVNGNRIIEHELQHGDELTIGDYDITYNRVAEPIAAPPPVATIAKQTGKLCPSCDKPYPLSAKICTRCGINIDTGKPIVISKELDENVLAGNVDTTVRAVSFFLPFGLFPIASEAFATKKPVATWVIFGITLLVSVWFFAATKGLDGEAIFDNPSVANLMHWTGDPGARQQKLDDALAAIDAEIKPIEQKLKDPNLTDPQRADLREGLALLKELRNELTAKAASRNEGAIGFRWYQLFTNALLHGGLMHFVGNMVFLLVFGLRVNELIGNLKFAIVYPLLAMGSSLINHVAHLHDVLTPNLGASGAIMGLAGMYLFLFPLQKVHTVIWLRIHWRFPCWYKVFRMRGFWLLALWIAFNDGLPMVLKAHDQVAHWAHIGGLIVGLTFAIGLLVGRLNTAYGGDLFSVTLGKRAWALIGKPRLA